MFSKVKVEVTIETDGDAALTGTQVVSESLQMEGTVQEMTLAAFQTASVEVTNSLKAILGITEQDTH